MQILRYAQDDSSKVRHLQIILERLSHRSRVSVGREAHATADREAGVTTSFDL